MKPGHKPPARIRPHKNRLLSHDELEQSVQTLLRRWQTQHLRTAVPVITESPDRIQATLDVVETNLGRSFIGRWIDPNVLDRSRLGSATDVIAMWERTRTINRALEKPNEMNERELFDFIWDSRMFEWGTRDKFGEKILASWWGRVPESVQRAINSEGRKYTSIALFKARMGQANDVDQRLSALAENFRHRLTAFSPRSAELRRLLFLPDKARKEDKESRLRSIEKLFDLLFSIPATKEKAEAKRDQRWHELWSRGHSYQEIRDAEIASGRVKALEVATVKQAIQRLRKPLNWQLRVLIYRARLTDGQLDGEKSTEQPPIDDRASRLPSEAE